MISQLRNEEKEYIDKILSNGLDEIKDVPSFDMNTISNLTNPIQNNDYLSYSNSSIHNNNLKNTNLNQLNFDYESNQENKNINLNNSQKIQKIVFPQLSLNENNRHFIINKYQNNFKENRDINMNIFDIENQVSPKTPTLNINNLCIDEKKNLIPKEIHDFEKNGINSNIINNKNKINENENKPVNYYFNNEKQNNINENFNNEDNEEYYFNYNNNNALNQNFLQKNENEKKDSSSFLIVPLDIPNNRQIIERALLNNQINLNNLNKQISGDNFANSLNDNINKKEVDLSVSTKKLINKYMDLQLSNNDNNYNNKINNINNKSIQNINENLDFVEKDMNNSLILGKNLNNNNKQKNSLNNSKVLKINDLSDIKINRNETEQQDKIDNKNKYYDIISDENIDEKPAKNKDLINKTKKNNLNKKYKPKSSALKKLIDKLKQEDNLDEDNDKQDFIIDEKKYKIKKGTKEENINKISNTSYNTSIQISQINDSELFTLGNSNITSSSEKSKFSKNSNKNANNINLNLPKQKKSKYRNSSIEKINISINNYPDTETNNTNTKKYKKEEKYLKINNSNEKYNKLKKEMYSIQTQIKNIFKRINMEDKNIKKNKNNTIKKTYSAQSIISNSKKRKFFPLSSTSSISSLNLDNISFTKKKKTRPYSVNSRNKSNKKNIKNNEDNKYKIKYKELKEKFELQKEKMKSEKQNIISLRQKIKIIENKFEKYPELIEYNNTLNEQNKILVNNINYSEEVRKKQMILIEALKNEINYIKNGNKDINLNKRNNEENNILYNEGDEKQKFDLYNENNENENI